MGKRGYMAVTVAALVVGASLSAVVANARQPWDSNPFFGSTEGTSMVVPPPASNLVASESEGTFTATHLGNGTYTAETTQDYGRHVEGEPEHQDQCAFVDGTLTLVAANGDELHVALDSDRSVTCAPEGQTMPAPNDVYTTTLFGEITGGTGRFTDATGYIFSEGTQTLNADRVSSVDEADIYGDIDIKGE